MIKAVETIPFKAMRKKTWRTQAVRDDIRAALDNRIPRFEFIGEIYCPNEVHTTFLNKSTVMTEAFHVMREYLQSVNIRIYNIFDICDPRSFFEVYRCPEPDRDRIFMEIDFEKLDRITGRLKEANK